MKRILFVLAASTLGLVSVAQAQDKPCMADAARLCANVEPGGGAQIACLKAHKSELSPACKKNVMKMKVNSMEQQQLEQQQQQPPPANP